MCEQQCFHVIRNLNFLTKNIHRKSMRTTDFQPDCENTEHQREVIKQSLLANDFDWIIKPQRHKHHQYGGLALGNVKIAENQKELNKHLIGAVISVFGEKSLFINPNIKHFRILISDNSRQNIKCFFNSAYKFIDQNISRTNVLVHCQAGVSRSTTITASYLMKQRGIGVETALEQIKKRRKHICPNKGFVKQLHQYEKQLKDQKLNAGYGYGSCEIM